MPAPCRPARLSSTPPRSPPQRRRSWRTWSLSRGAQYLHAPVMGSHAGGGRRPAHGARRRQARARAGARARPARRHARVQQLRRSGRCEAGGQRSARRLARVDASGTGSRRGGWLATRLPWWMCSAGPRWLGSRAPSATSSLVQTSSGDADFTAGALAKDLGAARRRDRVRPRGRSTHSRCCWPTARWRTAMTSRTSPPPVQDTSWMADARLDISPEVVVDPAVLRPLHQVRARRTRPATRRTSPRRSSRPPASTGTRDGTLVSWDLDEFRGRFAGEPARRRVDARRAGSSASTSTAPSRRRR